jgi:hypothetical protein
MEINMYDYHLYVVRNACKTVVRHDKIEAQPSLALHQFQELREAYLDPKLDPDGTASFGNVRNHPDMPKWWTGTKQGLGITDGTTSVYLERIEHRTFS